MAIDLESKVVRTPELMASAVDDELVVLNLATNHYIALDAIGRRIWEMIAEPYGVTAICETLSQEFDATPQQIEVDVKPFLDELLAEGMIAIVEK